MTSNRYASVACAISIFALALSSTGCASSAACIGGSTQSCLSTGTYAACDCSGGGGDAGPTGDTGPRGDAGPSACPSPLAMCGARCVDTSTDETHCGGCADATHTCSAGSFCVSGHCEPVGACAAPFLICGVDCIDPRADSAYCGATVGCAGASAGVHCMGACIAGRCVQESCIGILNQGLSTGDGPYLLDVDVSGPLGPHDAYCDMTTRFGGWTLVYAVHNGPTELGEVWWDSINLGAGEVFPAAPVPLAGSADFDGPTTDVRAAFARRSSFTGLQIRTTLLSATGTIILDVTSADLTTPLGLAASGYFMTPSPGCSGGDALVIGADASSPFAPGDHVRECYTTGSGDVVTILDASGGSASQDIFGTMPGDTTTLFWIRN